MRINVIFLTTLWLTSEGYITEFEQDLKKIPDEDYFSREVVESQTQLFGHLRELCGITETTSEVSTQLPEPLPEIVNKLRIYLEANDRSKGQLLNTQIPNEFVQSLSELRSYIQKHDEQIRQLPNQLIALVKIELERFFRTYDQIKSKEIQSQLSQVTQKFNLKLPDDNTILVPDYTRISRQLTEEITNHLTDFLGGYVKNILERVDVTSLTNIQIENNIKTITKEQEEKSLDLAWEEFKSKYNKFYPSVREESKRRTIFEENTRLIRLFNEQYRLGNKLYYLRINSFGDKTGSELRILLDGADASQHEESDISFLPCENVILPEYINWKHRGAVTDVKHQGECASCWAFSAAGALEAQNFRKTGVLKDVSVQDLLDCVKSSSDDVCDPGYMTPAFQRVKEMNGVEGEATNEYTKRERTCKLRREVVAKCTGHIDIPPGNELYLATAVATHGPVSSALHTNAKFSEEDFYPYHHYAGGIIYEDEANCPKMKENLTHAVLIVGYGKDEKEQKYWLVKNSYGKDWGEGGYFKINRGANTCGIATLASFPLV